MAANYMAANKWLLQGHTVGESSENEEGLCAPVPIITTERLGNV